MQLIKNLWQYRELFYFLTLRDIKVRYKQAILGFSWAILSPVVLAVVFWLIFGIFLKIQTGPIPYLLLVFAKLTFWNFFSQSITTISSSLIGNANLISKSAFPREILVFSTASSRLIDFLASFLVLILMMFFYHVAFSFQIIWLIPILLLEIILIIGLGFIFASLNVYFRDISALLPLLMTAWLFFTPVIYTVDSIPQSFRIVIFLNPMTGIIENIRRVLLLRTAPDFMTLAFSCFISVFIFILGYSLFKRLEKGFADVI